MITLPSSLPSELIESNIEVKSSKRARENSIPDMKPLKVTTTEHSSYVPFKSGNYVDLLYAVYDFNEKLGKYPSVDKLSDTMLNAWIPYS